MEEAPPSQARVSGAGPCQCGARRPPPYGATMEEPPPLGAAMEGGPSCGTTMEEGSPSQVRGQVKGSGAGPWRRPPPPPRPHTASTKIIFCSLEVGKPSNLRKGHQTSEGKGNRGRTVEEILPNS